MREIFLRENIRWKVRRVTYIWRETLCSLEFCFRSNTYFEYENIFSSFFSFFPFFSLQPFSRSLLLFFPLLNIISLLGFWYNFCQWPKIRDWKWMIIIHSLIFTTKALNVCVDNKHSFYFLFSYYSNLRKKSPDLATCSRKHFLLTWENFFSISSSFSSFEFMTRRRGKNL